MASATSAIVMGFFLAPHVPGNAWIEKIHNMLGATTVVSVSTTKPRRWITTCASAKKAGAAATAQWRTRALWSALA